MNEFTLCNKVIGVHWLKGPIENLQIKIKLKPQDNILALPKFEDYADESASINIKNIDNQYDEYIFNWQQKVFSISELQRYSDIHNCISDIELQHNETINQSDCEASKVFTYTHYDKQLHIPNVKSFEKKDCISDLGMCFESLKISDRVWRVLAEESSSRGHLFRSEENLAEGNEQWMAMEVVYDNSEYTEDSQLLVKQEHTLLAIYHNVKQNYIIIKPDVNNLELNPDSQLLVKQEHTLLAIYHNVKQNYIIIKPDVNNLELNPDSQLLVKQEHTLLAIYHNVKQNYIIIKPDVNNLELNPYTIETTGEPVGYKYSVDINFEKEDDNEELIMFLNKLYKKWERKHKRLVNFVLPPIGRKYYYWTLELISASDFEQDNLYVEFKIKIPESIKCEDVLSGRTHISKSRKVDGIKQWHFGHLVEFQMETGFDPPTLELFFEVISTDWWGRQRTEGYYYLPLTLNPGKYGRDLQCMRPEEMDRVEGESRRFFLGGCHLIKDLDVLSRPRLQNANFKYTSSGTLTIQWSVLTQISRGILSTKAPDLPGVSTASSLLSGAEAVLRKYRKARVTLKAATSYLQDGAGDGGIEG